ncbi:MAG: response regulator transcription factor [Actinomycetota bacterium]|nr:response regulator transcription factor [Actinomycetota bacterium]
MVEGRIDVLVADDHPVVLRGLQALIDDEEDMRVVATASEGDEALRRAQASRPDVIVLDLRMPGLHGPELIGRLVAELPETRVIVLSAADAADVALDVVKAGAVGFLHKALAEQRLVDEIRRAARRGHALGDEVIPELLRAIRAAPKANPLSEREVELVRMVADGMTNDQIARALAVGLSTVKVLLSGLFGKIGANDRASAVAVCFRNGWVT